MSDTITVKSRLSTPREGSANPQTRDTAGDLIVNLNSLNAEGNVFSLDGVSAFAGTNLGYTSDSSVVPQDSSPTGSALYGVLSVRLANNLKEIGDFAFQGATNLKEIELPESLTGIGSMAFQNNSKLSAVKISNLSAYCNMCFDTYRPYSPQNSLMQNAKHLYLNGEELTAINENSNIGTNISAAAFDNCNSLRTVTLDGRISGFESYDTFRNCLNLSSVYLSDNISLDDSQNTFHGCDNLEIISALGYIGKGAFSPETFFTIITNNKLKKIYLGKQRIANSNSDSVYTFYRKYDYVPQPGEDPSLSAVQIYYYSTLLGTEALSAQEDSPLAVDTDGTYLSTHPVPTLGRADIFSTFENYDIHVPTSMYKRWIAATNWNSISSHIYPYAPVSYVDPTMELEFDPNKTYIITDRGIGSIAMNVSPIGNSSSTLSAYDIAPNAE